MTLNRLSWMSVAIAAMFVANGCAAPPRAVAPTSAAQVGEFRHGMLNGYLTPAELPDSLALLPVPPAPGSAAQADDEGTFRELSKLLGTPRGALAVQDADLSFPHANEVFACALGVPISEQATPNLNMLLERTLTDAAVATSKAKDSTRRARSWWMASPAVLRRKKVT